MRCPVADPALAGLVDRRQLTVRSVALGATAVLAATSCTDRKPAAAVLPSAVPVSSAVAGPTSNLAGLAPYGVDIGTGVLIDVAGDGRDRFLRARRNGVVDFGGTGRQDPTLMVLRPAATRTADRVVINAPRWNPDLGGGYCVEQAAVLALSVRLCRPGDPDQIWHVVPVGDSGQFRLDGRYGAVHVDVDQVALDGLQTVPFSG